MTALAAILPVVVVGFVAWEVISLAREDQQDRREAAERDRVWDAERQTPASGGEPS